LRHLIGAHLAPQLLEGLERQPGRRLMASRGDPIWSEAADRCDQKGWSDMAKVLTIVSLLGLFAFAVWVVYKQWTLVVVDMPAWGWAALIAGAGFSLLVGFGLMALMFYSSRHGYDEGAQEVERERK